MGKFDETSRREEVAKINDDVKTNDKVAERQRLEDKYGQVWDTNELKRDFNVGGFLAPYVAVARKADGGKGFLHFQHMPRFYFRFEKI